MTNHNNSKYQALIDEITGEEVVGITMTIYQNENWENLIQLWKYSHIHLTHVIENVNQEKLDNEWISESVYGNIPLKDMITDFLRHFHLHLGEIQDLIDK